MAAIPVRYYPLALNDDPISGAFSSTNFMFWYPGSRRAEPDAGPAGWAMSGKRRMMPQATAKHIQGSGVKDFLDRRALLLPRSGGFFLIWLKTMPPVARHPFWSFAMGLAHYRHCGPSSPMEEFMTVDDLPREAQRWFPSELEVQGD